MLAPPPVFAPPSAIHRPVRQSALPHCALPPPPEIKERRKNVSTLFEMLKYFQKMLINILKKILVKIFWKDVGSNVFSTQMLVQLFQKSVGVTLSKKCWFEIL
jgi:hypothetical protein